MPKGRGVGSQPSVMSGSVGPYSMSEFSCIRLSTSAELLPCVGVCFDSFIVPIIHCEPNVVNTLKLIRFDFASY